MTSVLKGVVNWLDGSFSEDQEVTLMAATTEVHTQGVGAEREPISGRSSIDEQQLSYEVKEDASSADHVERSSKAAMKEDLMEVSMKAVHAAKEWGGYLFSLGKMTGGQVTKTAGYLKSAFDVQVFSDETCHHRGNVVTDDMMQRKSSEIVVAPWVGYKEAETMKSQILDLSKDKQNFLRSPPAGVEFDFDYNINYPVAQVMLEEDPNLQMMRFELVPKQIREETFWQNYFYRISLIKQSAQLTSLAKCSVLSQPSAVEVCDKPSSSLTADVYSDVCDNSTALNNQPFVDTLNEWEQDLDLNEYEMVSASELDIHE